MSGYVTVRTCAICCEEETGCVRRWKPRYCCLKALGDTKSPDEVIVCPSCLYNHVKSILDENGGAGGGRTAIQCPLSCGNNMTDVEIRITIRKHYFSIWKHGVLYTTLKMEEFCNLALLHSLAFCLHLWNRSWYHQMRSMIGEHFYRLRQQNATTQEERDALRRYEQWSVRTAIATRSNELKQQEELVCCPAPDCVNMWFASVPYRNFKRENEYTPALPAHSEIDDKSGYFRKAVVQKSNAIRKSLANFAHHLTWKPPSRDDEVEFLEGEEAKENFNNFWVDGYDYQPRRLHIQESENNDGRKMTCSLCTAEFCGLCRKPWVSLKVPRHLRPNGSSFLSTVLEATSQTSSRTSHDHKTCQAYGEKTSTTHTDDYAFVATALHARFCPGCSMRTQRSEGCNHMICPCGTEWCYVCECQWSSWHYGCALQTDANGNTLPPNDNRIGQFGCVIS